MKIIELLNKDAVSIDLKSQEKKDILAELVSLLVSSGAIKKADTNDVIKKLGERELLGSTGIGKGVAIPHAKCPKIKKMAAAFGVSKTGVDFKSLDGDKTHIFFSFSRAGRNSGPPFKGLSKNFPFTG